MAQHIDLNHAGPDELASIPGIDARRAAEIARYRAEHGPFHSWEEVEQVPGVGSTLTERLRAEATLGEAEDTEEIEEIDQDEIAALTAIANLDLEAALVYEIVAELASDGQLRDMLLSFADDHRRHVEELDRVVGDVSGKAPERSHPAGGTLVGLATTIGALDIDAAVETLVSNEELTNGTYETAMWVVSLSAAEPVLKKNASDEQRHLRSLLEYQQKRDTEGAGDDER